MSRDKYKTLQCLESAAVNSLISMNWDGTLVHILPMMQINFKGLQDHLNKFSENFDQVLAFKPTGWTYSDSCLSLVDIKPQTRGKITIYGISVLVGQPAARKGLPVESTYWEGLTIPGKETKAALSTTRITLSASQTRRLDFNASIEITCVKFGTGVKWQQN
ncbi:UNVERIFIED_CONTAM: hypothetical protein H355_009273 [Colinus virginianus]|nr:hypothetical protein H355_009273 [Colinus virginianus]